MKAGENKNEILVRSGDFPDHAKICMIKNGIKIDHMRDGCVAFLIVIGEYIGIHLITENRFSESLIEGSQCMKRSDENDIFVFNI